MAFLVALDHCFPAILDYISFIFGGNFAVSAPQKLQNLEEFKFHTVNRLLLGRYLGISVCPTNPGVAFLSFRWRRGKGDAKSILHGNPFHFSTKTSLGENTHKTPAPESRGFF